MTKEDLLERLQGAEWNDFEVKEAKNEVPKSVWETVSAFSNPNILRFFKLAKISENGGYGIDKILNWEKLTGCTVSISSDITKSEVVFNINQRQSTSINVKKPHKSLQEQVLTLIDNDDRISIAELASETSQSKSSIDRIIRGLKEQGKLNREGTSRNGRWIIER